MDQDERVFERAFHRRRLVDEVRREVALVELHAFDELERGLGRLAFFDRDHAVLADLFHRVGQEVADHAVVVRADRADVGDFFLAGDLLRHLVEMLDRGGDGLLDAAADRGRIAAGHDVAGAFAEDGAGEHGGGRRAVAGECRGLVGHFVHELRAHVLERVFELDFLAHGDAVLGDRRAAERLVDDHVAAGRAERNRHGVGQLVHAGEHLGPRGVVE